MPAVLVVVAAPVATVTAVVVTLFRTRKAERETKLENLKQERNSLPPVPAAAPDDVAELKPVVEFFKTLDACRPRRKLGLSRMDDPFGDFFFEVAHSSVGVKLLLDTHAFTHLKRLYSDWLNYRENYREKHKDDRHKDDRRNYIPGANTPAARRWARAIRSDPPEPGPLQRCARALGVSSSTSGRVLWNHALHLAEDSGSSTLVFWRLRFEPHYNQREMVNLIDGVCERFKVGGYVMYELLGPHDLLLRCWLRDAHSAESPSQTDCSNSTCSRHPDADEPPTRIVQMYEALRSSPDGATKKCDYFQVESIHRHWWWHDKHWWSRNKHCRPLTDEDTARYANCSDKDAMRDLVDRYNGEHIGRVKMSLNRAARRYRGENWIRRRRLHDGIKFVTLVRATDDASVGKSVRAHFVTVVEAATGISDRSLYECTGFEEDGGEGRAHFLLLGRVRPSRIRPGHFKTIREQIIKPITELDATITSHYTPPLTYIVTGPEVTRNTYKDCVELPEETPPTDNVAADTRYHA